MQNFRLRLDQEHYNLEGAKIFSDGALHVDLSYLPRGCSDYSLKVRLQSSDDILHCLLLCNSLHEMYPESKGDLKVLMFPYARQDRFCSRGQHFGMSVIAGMFKGLPQTLVTYDIHSDAARGLLWESVQNFMHVPQARIVASYAPLAAKIASGELQVVAPDKGAVEKAEAVADICGSPWAVCYATKTRDPKTGWLVTDPLNRDMNGQDVIIVDDIADGGATFIGLAEELKKANCGKISLYVTHGIFSKGFASFEGLIDNIYTTDSFRRNVGLRTNVKVTTIKL